MAIHSPLLSICETFSLKLSCNLYTISNFIVTNKMVDTFDRAAKNKDTAGMIRNISDEFAKKLEL